MKKNALITGITGQDGAYLAKYLLSKNYNVFGTYRRLSTPNFWRLQYFGIFDKINFIPCDLLDSDSLYEALTLSQPKEIYNLAAQSFVGASFEQPVSSGEITGLGVTRLLESVRKVCPNAKVYQASTSELYGDNIFSSQNEDTTFQPSSPYAVAKLYGYMISEVYRKGYGLFACNGILFNHESPLRGLEFVTRKITNSVAKIKLGLQENLALGNMKAKRDWGYAEDYVKAMWLMLQQDSPENYVIATGEAHTVEEFADIAFDYVGLDYRKYITSDKRFFRPADVSYLCGDSSKATKELGWKAQVKFSKLVEIMVEEDLRRWNSWLNGKQVYWDGLNYPNENKIMSRKLITDK